MRCDQLNVIEPENDVTRASRSSFDSRVDREALLSLVTTQEV
jgi:hypothetical protein